MIEHDDLPLLGNRQDGVHVQVVLRRIILAREEGTPEDRSRPPPAVREDHIAAQVVPAHQTVKRGHAADAFRLRVADPFGGGGVELFMHERAGHSSSRNRVAASSGRVGPRHGDPDGQSRGRGRKSLRLTVRL